MRVLFGLDFRVGFGLGVEVGSGVLDVAPGFLDVALDLVGCTFVGEVLVVGGFAYCLFDLAFGLVEDAFYVGFVHRVFSCGFAAVNC